MKIAHAQNEFIFTDKDFDIVRSKLRRLSGIHLTDNKDSMVYNRLARRIRSLKLSSVTSYLHYLERHSEEQEEFINALTTNLTSFFREKHHFDILHDYLIELNRRKKPITIWCAASSTGEEAYSIGITVMNAMGHLNVPVHIIATDIDSHVLSSARKGIFSLDSIENLSTEIKKRYFKRGVGANSGTVKIVSELQRLITFKQLNLIDKQYDLPLDIDIVFCRNVMIYFSQQTQLDILRRIDKYLSQEGRYFAGHSESLSQLGALFLPLGKTVYRVNPDREQRR